MAQTRPHPVLIAGLTLTATLLSALAASARRPASPPPAAPSSPALAATAGQPPQQLPLEAQWCLPDGSCIALEVADEPREQAMGLQLRGRLPRLRGMWFPFRPAQTLRFWMHRTPEPLDMLFLREGRVIAIEAGAAPCPHLPCRSYGPDEAADGVVELAAGEAARLGITIGSPAVIRPLTPGR
ncbi:MAG: DUF192 domain-containing protein [Cyanobacteriota bacterium]|nr:DUF192 domain-containing protein [Cyanobacteriota bacterium]